MHITTSPPQKKINKKEQKKLYLWWFISLQERSFLFPPRSIIEVDLDAKYHGLINGVCAPTIITLGIFSVETRSIV